MVVLEEGWGEGSGEGLEEGLEGGLVEEDGPLRKLRNCCHLLHHRQEHRVYRYIR